MNQTPSTSIESVLSAFMAAAGVIVVDGLNHARADDPHRFATLAHEFDGGQAVRRLQVDYLSGGRVRIALLLLGLWGGEEKVVEVFATTLQSISGDAKTH